jgi:hypothetical protein
VKISLIIVALVLSTISYSQSHTFKAQLYIYDSLVVSGGVIIFPLTNDTVKIGNSDTAVIDLTDAQKRVFYFLWSGWKSKIYRFDTDSFSSDVQKVMVPDRAYYDHFEKRRICPLCMKSKYLTPIVYGMPDPKLMNKAKHGKVILGGCVGGAEHYFCDLDNFQF